MKVKWKEFIFNFSNKSSILNKEHKFAIYSKTSDLETSFNYHKTDTVRKEQLRRYWWPFQLFSSINFKQPNGSDKWIINNSFNEADCTLGRKLQSFLFIFCMRLGLNWAKSSQLDILECIRNSAQPAEIYDIFYWWIFEILKLLSNSVNLLVIQVYCNLFGEK